MLAPQAEREVPPASRRPKGFRKRRRYGVGEGVRWSWALGRGRRLSCQPAAGRAHGPLGQVGMCRASRSRTLLQGKLVCGTSLAEPKRAPAPTASRGVPCSPHALACALPHRKGGPVRLAALSLHRGLCHQLKGQGS